MSLKLAMGRPSVLDDEHQRLIYQPSYSTFHGQDGETPETEQQGVAITNNRSAIFSRNLVTRLPLIMLILFTLFYGIYYLKAVTALTRTVALGYATYEGTVQSNGVTKWLGMRYAAAPVGDLRFAAPQDPPVVGGVQQADKVDSILCHLTVNMITDCRIAWSCLSRNWPEPASWRNLGRLFVY